MVANLPSSHPLTTMNPITEIAAALASEQVLQKSLADGSGVILDLSSSRVLALNTTGMFIVDQIREGATTETLIVDLLTTEFEAEAETARLDLEKLLTDILNVLPRASE